MKVEALKHCIDYRWSTLRCNRTLSNILVLLQTLVMNLQPCYAIQHCILDKKIVKTQSLLNLFDLYLQITRVMVLLDQINIVPVVALHNRSVQVNIPQVPKFINQRLHFPKSNITFVSIFFVNLEDYF